jgi:hypothetical protein
MARFGRGFAVVSIFAFCAGATFAQCGVLPAVYNGTTYCTNGGGPMFDMVALNPAGVHVSGFDVNLNAGVHAISVYVITGGGTFVGNELVASAWTLIGTATAVSSGPGGPTHVPLAFDVYIPPAGVQAFHVRAAAGGLRYSNAGTLGSVLAANADLQVLTGSSQCNLGSGPFTGNVPSPRQFNGTVYYNPEYQTNQPAAALDVDGVQGTFCTPAIVTKLQGAPGTLSLASTNVGAGFEVIVAFAPLAPASGGALVTASHQILSVNLGAPLFFLNGGLVPNFSIPFPGPFSAGFIAPSSSFTASVQMVVIDPTHPDGFVLSQPVQIDIL